MSMSIHVIGFVPPDDRFKQMKAVYDSCTAAGIEPPDAVKSFFNWGTPSDHGTEVGIPKVEWTSDMREGYEIDLTKLPSSVKILRFYCSY